mgnify:CR=1 FL=1
MTLREHISIARRSWRLLYSMSRRFFAAILAYSVVTALLPYIPVWFSARLIDALAAGAGVQVLIRYAALTVGLTALGTLLSAVLNAQKEIGFQEANCGYEWMHAEKAMALAYASIEDRKVSLLRERIQTETRMGWNVFYLDSCIEKFVRFGVQIFASIALTASFFTLHAIAPAAKLAFVGGILVSLTVAVLTSARSSAINMEFFKDSVTENITLDKYSTYIRNYSKESSQASFFSLEEYESGAMTASLEAAEVRFNPETKRWSARRYTTRTFDSLGVETFTQHRNLDTLINLDVNELGRTDQLIKTMNIVELNQFLEQQQSKGSDSINIIQVEQHARYAYPVGTFILTLIGVSLSSRKVRGGTGLHIGIGIALCFSYILFIRFFEEFAKSGTLPPWIAVWIPNVLYLCIAVYLYRKAPK